MSAIEKKKISSFPLATVTNCLWILGWNINIKEEQDTGYRHIQCNTWLAHAPSLYHELPIWDQPTLIWLGVLLLTLYRCQSAAFSEFSSFQDVKSVKGIHSFYGTWMQFNNCLIIWAHVERAVQLYKGKRNVHIALCRVTAKTCRTARCVQRLDVDRYKS